MEKVNLNIQAEERFGAIMPPMVCWLLDVLLCLHPELRLQEVVVVKEEMAAGVIINSVETIVNSLSPEYQEELRGLAKMFGDRLTQTVEELMWTPKIVNGKIVGFRRKIKRRPRLDSEVRIRAKKRN